MYKIIKLKSAIDSFFRLKICVRLKILLINVAKCCNWLAKYISLLAEPLQRRHYSIVLENYTIRSELRVSGSGLDLTPRTKAFRSICGDLIWASRNSLTGFMHKYTDSTLFVRCFYSIDEWLAGRKYSLQATSVLISDRSSIVPANLNFVLHNFWPCNAFTLPFIELFGCFVAVIGDYRFKRKVFYFKNKQ